MGGLKGSGCRWLWGMESLNRSLTSPSEPVLINWPWGRKKRFLRLQYDPPERCQVRFGLRTPVGTRGVGFVCVCVWAVRREG